MLLHLLQESHGAWGMLSPEHPPEKVTKSLLPVIGISQHALSPKFHATVFLETTFPGYKHACTHSALDVLTV